MISARSHDREDIAEPEDRLSHYAVQKLSSTGKTVFIADARHDRRYRAEEARHGKKMALSIAVLPLKVGGDVRGGLYADHRFDSLTRPQESEGYIASLVSLAAVALALKERRRGTAPPPPPAEPVQTSGGAAAARTKGSGPLERRREETALEARPAGLEVFHGLVSANPDVRDVFDTVRSLAKADLPVLICGETGTGKSALARAVHEASTRRKGPFVTLLCGAIPEDLIESEVLGHSKGAFTGAEADRDGVFAQAHEGTLFLDEVADMSPGLQKKLLRVLEDGKVRPLGAKEPLQVDVRIVASTASNLERLVRDGEFRRDLFYRLKSVVIDLPPLRDRREDVIPLAAHFLGAHAARTMRTAPRLDPQAGHKLLRHPWPGNVREIENEMRRLVALGRAVVRTQDLDLGRRDAATRGSGPGVRLSAQGSLLAHVESAEREAILDALSRAQWNKSRAAARLGITRKSLYRRMTRYKIPQVREDISGA